MTWVTCDKADCIFSTDTGCGLSSIDIDQDGQCIQCRTNADRDFITGKFEDE